MRKLAWFTGGFAAVCLMGCYGPAGCLLPCAAGAGAGFLLSLILWLAIRRRPSPGALFAAARRALALCLGGLLAAGWFWGWTALFRAPAETLAGQTCSLTGTVTSYPRATSIGGWSMVLSLEDGPTAPDLMLYAPADWGGLVPGDRVRFTARLKSSGLLYGEETTYYTAKGIFLLAYCDDPPAWVETSGETSPRFWPARCARALKDSLSSLPDSGTAPLSVAVTTGDKDGLSAEMRSALNRSGAAHTVVVSGMHISFLVAAALTLTRHRRRTAILFVPLLLFYAFMAGGTPSALRAVIMQAVFLAAPIFRRENDPPTSLGFALLILLLADPNAAGSVSLQLSFASAAGILLVLPPLSRRMLRPINAFRKNHPGKGWAAPYLLCRAAVVSSATSLGAMLFASPLLCLYFRQVSLLFPLTNLLVLWAVSLFFLLSLLAGTLGVFLPGAAAVPGFAAGLFGRYIIRVVTALGQWKFAAVDTGNFYYLLCFLAVYLFLAAGLLLRRHRLRLPIPLGCLALLLCAALAFSRRPVYSALTVTALDVGQGSSTAFFSAGQTCLVDCGGSGDNAGDTAADCFASMGVDRLDLLVLTHFDADHFNGVAQLFARMDIDQVAIPDVEAAYGRMEELLALAEAEGAIVTYVTEETELPLGESTLTLYPPLGSGTSNEEGLFVLCSAGDFDVLITGDADSFVENMLLKYYNIPDIELLLAGHHGSAGSTSEALLDALRPELAVISVGYNTYGHPAPQTLERLEARGITIYRTDTMGSVTIEARSDGYAAQTQN